MSNNSMGLKKHYPILLKLVAKPGETPQETMERVDRENQKSFRRAEVEEILAENALYNIPIPGDVSKGEIRTARQRFYRNEIFKLARTNSGFYGEAELHGISFTESARGQVLKKAAARVALERDADALSQSRAIEQIISRMGR